MPILGAYVVPHPPLAHRAVGRGKERHIADTLEGFRRVAADIAKKAPDTVILISPHAPAYADYFHITPGDKVEGSLAQFGAPEAVFSYELDTTLCEAIADAYREAGLPGGLEGASGDALDHGAMVPLHFIEEAYSAFRLVRLSPSGLRLHDHLRAGLAIHHAVERTERRVVLIASGDLSHRLKHEGPYGFAEEGPLFDEQLVEVLRSKQFERLATFDASLTERAAECGLRPFTMMGGALEGLDVDAHFHSYEGPFGVGYAVVSYSVKDAASESKSKQEASSDEAKQSPSPHVRLARGALQSYLKHGRIALDASAAEALFKEAPRGTFVTLFKDGNLRGCIGTERAQHSSLPEEIAAAAVAAARQDPRFPPVEREELDELEIKVDVLEPAERTTFEDLDPAEYGILVEAGDRRGILLPDLEGIDTARKQLAVALKKAGIGPGEPYTLKRFTVTRHR